MVNKRILLIDDSARIREFVRASIESRPGFEVCGEAADGLEGIEKARKLVPDLIVLDVSMPRMNGLEAAPVLQLVVPNAPIILFTAYKDAISRGQAHDVGAACVLSKTEQLESIADEIQRLATPEPAKCLGPHTRDE